MLNVPVPDSPVAASAVSVNGPYAPACAHVGVQETTPVFASSVAPAGSGGATDHVTGPVAQLVRLALGAAITSADNSSTAAGSLTATVTVPGLCVTVMLNVPEPDSPVAASAVSVN